MWGIMSTNSQVIKLVKQKSYTSRVRSFESSLLLIIELNYASKNRREVFEFFFSKIWIIKIDFGNEALDKISFTKLDSK